MPTQNINSVVSVIPVKNFELTLEWYRKLFGRDPDVVPMEGIAEWQLVENAWIQVSIDPERAGSTTVVIGVNDIEEQSKAFSDANLPIGEIVEYPEIIKMAEIIDPEGNKISFVQDISNNSGN
ncbi:VOC family protein [Neptunomonas sp.]|uniref:VOC family protein n=1 Tax=Neptunomonas sp. TaxID=1971898 RepID=UPI0025DC7315|nr:VOC family protein [Neptunomonas sp.]